MRSDKALHVLVLASVAVAWALVGSPAVAETSFADLLRRVPAGANALIMLDVARGRQSEFIQREGYLSDDAEAYATRKLIPPAVVERGILCAQVEIDSLHPVWEAGLIATKADVSADVLSRLHGGQAEALGNVPAVRLDTNAYLAILSPRLVGIMTPANRQAAARWATAPPASEPPLPSYLQVVSRYPETAGTHLLVALDLAFAIDRDAVAANRARFEQVGVPPESMDQVIDTLASVRGMALGVLLQDRAIGSLRVDFGKDASVLGPFAKTLLLAKLADWGATIDEFANWTAEVRGTTVFLKGEFTVTGLRRVLSLIDPPLPQQYQPAQPVPAPSATGTEPSPGELDPKASATLTSFKAVQHILADLRRPQDHISGTVTTGRYGLWLEKYARKIDHLPMLNVDPDFLDLREQISAALRVASGNFRSVGIKASTESSNPTVNVTGGRIYFGGGYFGGIPRYGVQYTQSASNVVRRRTTAVAASDQLSTMQDINNAMGQMRRVLTERYQVEF